jgi:hypothetical protein
VTVSYGLPDGLVPRVLVEGCEPVEAEPAPGDDNHATLAWTYRRDDGTPLPRGGPTKRTLEISWLDALRHRLATASLRVVRNAGAAPAFVTVTRPVAARAVAPFLDSDAAIDLAALSPSGSLHDRLAALVTAMPGEGLTADVAVTCVHEIAPGVSTSVPVTLLPGLPWDAALPDAVAPAVTAWQEQAEPPAGSSYAFEVTLSDTAPLVRLRGLTVRLADPT